MWFVPDTTSVADHGLDDTLLWVSPCSFVETYRKTEHGRYALIRGRTRPHESALLPAAASNQVAVNDLHMAVYYLDGLY